MRVVFFRKHTRSVGRPLRQMMSGGRELRLRNPSIYEQLVFFETSLSDNDIIKVGRCSLIV